MRSISADDCVPSSSCSSWRIASVANPTRVATEVVGRSGAAPAGATGRSTAATTALAVAMPTVVEWMDGRFTMTPIVMAEVGSPPSSNLPTGIAHVTTDRGVDP